ncbi:hypothetical protein Y032_0006g3116 [Ancylostoma ceylanicum]|nr:hypothetical protein Y032_0006g3116 [Ancylostoma ceylanicum]
MQVMRYLAYELGSESPHFAASISVRSSILIDMGVLVGDLCWKMLAANKKVGENEQVSSTYRKDQSCEAKSFCSTTNDSPPLTSSNPLIKKAKGAF